MAGDLPEITLTDPNNRATAPTTPFSPVKDASGSEVNGAARGASGRPVTPTSRANPNRPDSSSGWTSPSRLVRRLSSNGAPREEANGKSETQPSQPTTIDPLSEHILKRTNTPLNLSNNTRPTAADNNSTNKDENVPNEQTFAPAVQSPIRRTDTTDSLQAQKDLRKGVKAVSFISRLMGNKKKEEEEEMHDDESVSNEGRPEGNDAEVFAQPVDNIGFSPRQPQPPAYIKVRSKYKKERDFDRVFLAQELNCQKRRKGERQNSSSKLRRKSSAPPASDANTVWAMEFSRDGKYLAAAGVDGIVRVWQVLSSSEDRQNHEKQESTESEENGADPHAEHLSAPVFQSRPIREYAGHTSTVLDLSWSKNNFLLSSSMDRTVRLWHVTRSQCLCTFKHNDFVPSISFHPKDDRFFLAGSLDSKLRLWSIPDKSVAYTAQVPDMITAVAFTPDGKYGVAGCLSGLCMFYEIEGMKYQTQIHVRSSRGQNAKGSKITGIHAHHDARGDTKLLITSNDSRVRLYNFRDKSLELKFRGNQNNCSQIRATLSDDGRYVVCGSEDRKAYIWSMGPAEGEKRDKRPMEMFEAHDTITTAVCFAPMKTRHHLSRSEDPVFDLCNPPPVTLMSRAERAESQTSSRPQSMNGSIQATPAEFEGKFVKPNESPSFLSRSSHKDGNVIVTADFTGKIKVFRQDCAWSKRRVDDDRSSLFSKRNGRGRMSRTGSIMTMASQKSVREGRQSMQSISGPSDRIISWRQGVVSSPSIADSQRRSSNKTSSRSISPRKSVEQQQRSRPSEPIKWQDTIPSNLKSSHPLAADVMVNTSQTRASANDNGHAPDSPRSMHSLREDNPLMIQGGRSYVFWDTDEWKQRADRMHKMTAEERPLSPIASPGEESDDGNHLAVRPPLTRDKTYVSELSDERSSTGEEFDDAHEENDDGGGMKCRFCGSLSVSARKGKEGTGFVCSGCGMEK